MARLALLQQSENAEHWELILLRDLWLCNLIILPLTSATHFSALALSRIILGISTCSSTFLRDKSEGSPVKILDSLNFLKNMFF
jgi:hypothetical protein